jgi:peptidoglycan/xylan/chitin deacetylase (PgdA/CDA1 family)
MEIAGAPPATGKNISTIMVSGGYPITANLSPGFYLNITAFDQPISCYVREERTEVDGVWTDPEEPTFALHSVRDRAAITHGNYGGGRFVWTGFTIGSGQNEQEQRDSFQMLMRSAMLWAGHQVQAFKPVWPESCLGVLSITQDIFGPEDVNPAILELTRKHRVPMTSFIRPEVMQKHPEALALLVSAGEIGLLGNPDADYEGRSLAEQQREFASARALIKTLTGTFPQGFRLPGGRPFSDHTQDALVRAGFSYLSVQSMDRMVPKAVRGYRRLKLVTRARTLWKMPETPYLKSGHPNVDVENTMPLHFSQILALGGLYALSFTPSAQDADFPVRLNALIEMAKRERIPVKTLHGVTTFWEGWDNIKIATRYVSPQRTSLKISNTWVKPVDHVMVNVEMPGVLRQLDIESMTLGTVLPDSMSHSGVRWRLHLNRLGAGKNVVYYINMRKPIVNQRETVDGSKADAVGEIW